MTNKQFRSRRMIFPVMLLFLVAYILVSPSRLTDKAVQHQNQAESYLPQPKEKLANKKSTKVTERYVKDQVLVKTYADLGSNPDPLATKSASINNLNRKYKAKKMTAVGKKDPDLKRTYVLTFTNQNVKKILKDYQESKDVELAELNLLAKASVTNPNDPKFLDGTQWGLNQAGDHDIDAPEGWDRETGDAGTVIAIIDSGVDLDHPDLAANIWNNSGEVGGGKESNNIDDDGNGYIDDYQGWDWVTSYNNWPADNDPTPEPDGINNDGWYGTDDGVEHGTHVAGIAAAATNNGVGVAGACWNCKIMALRILDDEGWGDYSDIVQAIEYAADNGADVINMSLGGGYSEMLDDVIEYAYKNDVVIVAATGNENINIGTDMRSPACNDGSENRVVAVGASTSSDTLAGFSNYGAYYTDVIAPGSSIYSTLYTNDPVFGFTNDYGYMSGTSMASPYVAGLAGLIKSQNPTWSGPEVRDRTIDLSDNIDSLNPGYYQKLGSGRINLNKTLNPANGAIPSGTVVKVSGYTSIWLIENGNKKLIPSSSFRPYYMDDVYDIVYVSLENTYKYPWGPDARFPDGVLLGALNSGRIYVISDRYRRRIPDASTFSDLGYDSSDVKWFREEYSHYISGPNMFSGTHDTGAVVTTDNVNYYRIDDYLKDQIESPGTFATFYTLSRPAVQVSAPELASYDNGLAIRYPDGKLVGENADGKIYYIEHGKKRQFTDVNQLTSLGYRENNVIWLAGEAVHYSNGQAMGF